MKVKFNSLKVVIFVIFFSPTMEGISQTIQTKDEVDINSKQYLFFRNMIDSFTYSPNKNKGLLQSSATYQSFYGNYDKALYYFSEVEPPFSFPFKAEKLKQYVPKPYIEILDSLAKTNRIIIFNEAHHVPQHRITTLNSLKILYKNGFRYLALEALGNDSSINILKYPLFNKDGFLINEPCYGDLVREALKIGFKVISYDIASKDVKTREITEAQNIYNKILKKDSNAKIVIHCGFSHGFDKKIEDNPDFSMMGYYLKEISNIDPLFINQVSTSERLPKLRQRSDYTFFSDSFHFKTPSFFFSNEKGYWKGEPWDGDMVLFLPQTEIENGRPTWLKYNGREKYYYIKKQILDNLETPFLIQAFIKKEGTSAVPFDQVEVYDKNKNLPLLLKNGKYIIRIIDRFGVVKFSNEIKIL